MNVEQTLRQALTDHVGGLEPDPGGWDLIRRRARGRRRLPLVPVTAAVAVLTLLVGIGVVANRDAGPPPVTSARVPADLYLRQGSIWPLQSRADAEAWRRDPASAPYLADAELTAREFLESVRYLPTGPLVAAEVKQDSAHYSVEGDGALEVLVAREPGQRGPWVVTAAGPDGNNGWPTHWRPERVRRVTSPVDVRVVPVFEDYTVEIAELGRGGRYVVLGSARMAGIPPDGIADVRVDFRQPSGGFGVIAVRGYDKEGRLSRAHYMPTSFDDPWPFVPATDDRWPARPRPSGQPPVRP